MSADSSQLLRIYLSRLVKSLVPPELGSDYIETIYHELLDFTESNHKDSSYEVEKVLFDIKSKFSSTGNLGQWDRFQEAVERLTKFKNPESIARYLVFLEHLTTGNDIYGTKARNSTVDRITSSYIPYNNRDNLDFQNEAKSISGSFYGPNVGGDSFENINFDRFSDRRSIYSAAQNRSINDSKNYTLEEVVIPYFENHIRGEDILNYISFTLVGTTSNLFPLKSGEVELPEAITNSESGLLHISLECGLIYQSLGIAIENFKSGKFTSSIKNAIMSYIFEELTNYMKMVNILSNKQGFSLRSLLADLLDELVKLRFLYYLTKRVEKESGDKLLSLIYKYHNFGDIIIRDCSTNLLRYSLEPFSSCLCSWLVDGELIDKSNEFFIVWNSIHTFSDKDLNIEYVKDKVPNFFPEDLGFKIYLIGKTNIFLKRYCKESKWCNGFSQRLNIHFNRTKNKNNSFNDSEFHKLILDHYNEITNYFNYIIYTKYHFMDTLRALKDFLFMGKGDFMQRIVTNGSELLNEPSNSLSGHQLTKVLQDSALGSTVRHGLKLSDEYNVLNNLDARVLEIGHGNIGWDVFTLDYQLQLPISLILNNESNQHKKDYLKVFNYLWKFKRLESLFTEEWKNQKNLKHKKLDTSLFKKINRVRLIQNFLRDFARTIERFILEEIIEAKYEEIASALNSSKNCRKISIVRTGNDFKISKGILKPNESYLNEINGMRSSFEKKLHGYREHSIDALKNLHVEYLTSITNHKLINGTSPNAKGKISNKYYINQLNSLINSVFRFIITAKEFNVLVDEMESMARFAEDYHDSDSLNGRFSIIYNNLLKIFNEFNSDLKVLINDLSNDDDLSLRYLGISLNQ